MSQQDVEKQVVSTLNCMHIDIYVSIDIKSQKIYNVSRLTF